MVNLGLESVMSELLDHDLVAADARRSLRVYLAAPVKVLSGEGDKVISLAQRGRISRVRDALLDAGVSVFSTQHGDAWVTRGMGIGLRAPSTFRALQSADLVVGHVSSPVSPACALELGWATALRKPLVLLLEEPVVHSALIDELEAVVPVLPLSFEGEWTTDMLRHAVVTAMDWADLTVDLIPAATA